LVGELVDLAERMAKGHRPFEPDPDNAGEGSREGYFSASSTHPVAWIE